MSPGILNSSSRLRSGSLWERMGERKGAALIGVCRLEHSSFPDMSESRNELGVEEVLREETGCRFISRDLRMDLE